MVALVDLELETGTDSRLPAVLSDLIARYPLCEPLWERTIWVLAAADRTAEALATYASCRRALADELGVEPSEPLRRLYLELLAADSAPEPARRQELPRDVGHFVGRAEEIRGLATAARSGSAVVVVASDGMAGVGKTNPGLRHTR